MMRSDIYKHTTESSSALPSANMLLPYTDTASLLLVSEDSHLQVDSSVLWDWLLEDSGFT